MDTSDECSTSKIISSNNDNENLQFSLSAIIQAHSDDAKCVIETPTGTLISGGRDGFMKIWTNEGINWTNTSTVQQKDCLAINSIALGSAPDAGFESLIFLGRKNGSVAIYNAANTEEPVKVLQGHKSNVCALYFDDKTGFLMSGSWDHNAVVWPLELLLKEGPDRVPIGFLSGHKCSVWAVATVPSKLPKFLTGSADKSIKLWSKDYDVITEFFGHTDVVRSLIVISEVYFFSTSNDATIILWDIPNCTRLRNFLPQHDNFIYTMSLLHIPAKDNFLLSAGEGGCIDIWKLEADANLIHKFSMKVPVQSIWSISALRNGDFAIASSSGMVLIFTADPSRRAPDDIQEFFYSSQYEELAFKEKETQAAKDPTFDMSRFSTKNDNIAANDGFFHQVVTEQNGNAADFQDPITGSGRYVPGSSSVKPVSIDKKRPQNNFVPLGDFYTFGKEGVSQKLFACLLDMNLTLFQPLKMTDDEICAASQILKDNTEFEITECHVVTLEKALDWPLERAVPAFDLFRIALLHPKLNEIFCSLKSVLGNPPKGQSTISRLLSLLTKDSPDPVLILSCRSLANAASHSYGREMLLSATSAFSSFIPEQLYSSKQALQISSATALANFASILLKNSEAKSNVTELGPREDILRSLILVLQKTNNYSNYSPIALFRILQTIIMLMWGQSTLIYLAIEQSLPSILKQIKDGVSDEDIKSLIRDAEGMIFAI
uniref:PUL domain-containing protein n=1 Tax=Meloidogyne incognita TaxID=6306 RepID=A0A914KKQ2_MELIC